MFDGIEGVKIASESTPLDKLKVALVGPPKGGKSRLAVTAEGIKFVFDYDDRAESIAGTPDTFVQTCFDTDRERPTAFNKMEQTLGMFEYKKSLGKLDEIPDVIIHDSFTYLAEWAKNYFFTANAAGKLEYRVGGSKIVIPRGYDPWEAEKQMLENTIRRSFALAHTICVFHEGPEKADDSTQEDPRYTGRVAVAPKRLNKLLTCFNEVWRVTCDPENGKFRVTTRPTMQFLGATALMIETEEEPNISMILAKHRANYEALHPQTV